MPLNPTGSEIPRSLTQITTTIDAALNLKVEQNDYERGAGIDVGQWGDELGLANYATTSTVNTLQTNLYPRLENRQALRDFYAGIYAFATAPTTNRVGIAYYGDSVSSHVSEQFINRLITADFNRCDFQHPAALTSGLTIAKTGTALTYDPSTRSVDQSVNDGTGGFRDFTYLPSSEHFTLASGSIITFDVGETTGYSEARAYFATGPGMGSVFVELINRDTSAVISSQTIDLSAGSIGGTKAAFTAISQTTKYRLRITATGVVVSLHTIFLRPYGIIPVNFGCGGSTLTQNNFSNATIFTYLCNDLNVKLIFLQAKEENHTVSIPLTMTRLNLLTSCSKIVVGSLPDVITTAEPYAQNAVFRSQALASGMAYFDGFACIGTYAELVRLSWISDGTHPLTPANRYVAGLLHAEIGILGDDSSVVRKSIDHTYTSNYVASTEISVISGTRHARTQFARASVNDAGYADLMNIKQIYFDNTAGATNARISGRDSLSVTVLLPNNSVGNIYLGKCELVSADDNVIWAPSGGATFNRDVNISGTNRGFRVGGTSGPMWSSGTGSPEGVLSRPVGSLYSRTDGGASTTLYVKESGTGNTGWIAK
jgi:hypothetical protein